MRKLPLYPEFPHAAVSTVGPLQQNTDCQLCDLAKANPSGQRCMSADGTAGDILVVSDHPIEFERNFGRVMTGSVGKLIRKLVGKAAGDRAVVYTNAIGCVPPSSFDDFDKSIDACRPYVADVFAETDPQVVLLFGPKACQSILGRRPGAFSVRNGYGWIKKANGVVIPAFILIDPLSAIRNELVARALEEDVRWALSSPKILGPQHDAVYELIQTAADAEAAWEALCASVGFIATDTETSGMMFAPDFRIEMASVSNGKRTFVFDRCVFANDPEVLVILCKILSLLKHTSWNGQYDYCAFQADPLFFPIRDDAYSFDDGLCHKDDYSSVMNLWSDARVKRKLYEADAEANLAVSAELVGMGGHKLENRALVEQICEDLHKYALSFTLTETGKKRTWKGSNFFKASDVPEKWVYYLNEGIAEEKFAHRFVPREVEQRYNALDALSTWHLENWAHDRLVTYEDDGLLTIWNEVCQSTMWAYCRMRTNGMPVSSAGVGAFRLLLESEMEMSLKSIHRRRPGLNPLSNPQVVELMKDLGIKSKRKTGSGNLSASKEVLEEFRHKHDIIGEILSYRTLQKIHGTYAVGMTPWITPDDCVHPSILQSGTATGRPSAAEPNLLNVVKGRDADTRRIASMFRNCFVAPPGHSIIEADEKQIEIRAAAEFSEDPLMVQTIVSGVDFHKASAEKFAAAMGKDYAAMTDEQKDLLREQSKCFHPDTEVLTRFGWMRISDLAASPDWRTTEVVQAIPANGGVLRLEWVLPEEVFTKVHPSRKLIHLKNESIDLRVTPDHRMLEWKDSGEFLVTLPANFSTSRSGYWMGAGELQDGSVGYADALLRLAVATQADGSFAADSDGIKFGFSKRRKRDRLVQLLSDASLQFTETRNERSGVWSIYVNASGARSIRALLDADKTIPWSWLQLSLAQRLVVIEEAEHWDGTAIGGGRSYHYSSAVEKNADVLQAIAATSGRKTTKRKTPTTFRVSVKDRPYARGGHLSREAVDYTDEVACLSVPSTFVLVRDGGIPVVTGQTTNFAAVYEIPCELPFMLQSRLKITRREAEDLGKSIFQSYTRLREWMDEMYAYSHATGSARTYWKGKFGRRRPLWGLGFNPPTLAELEKALESSKGYGQAQSGKYDKSDARATYNTPVQGGAVDIVASMLWIVQRWLDANTDGGKLVLHVYDSIMVVVKDADVQKTVAFLRLLMSDSAELKQGYTTRVPLGVDIKYGRTWSTLKKVE